MMENFEYTWDYKGWEELGFDINQLDWNQTLMTKFNQMKQTIDEDCSFICAKNLIPLINTLAYKDKYIKDLHNGIKNTVFYKNTDNNDNEGPVCLTILNYDNINNTI